MIEETGRIIRVHIQLWSGWWRQKKKKSEECKKKMPELDAQLTEEQRWISRIWNCGSIRIEKDGSRTAHLVQAKGYEWRYKEK